jgi:O-antigen/teichoic acid export membrane protein
MSMVEPEERERLAVDAVRVLLVLVTPLVVGGVFALEPFLSWWMDPAFAQAAAPAGRLLLLGTWANSLARTPFVHLQARGRPDLVAKAHLAELVPYLLLLYLALARWGIVGAAAAWCARVVADALLLFAASGIPRRVLRLFVAPALMLAIAVASSGRDAGPVGWSIRGALVLASVAWAMHVMPPTLPATMSRVLARRTLAGKS